MSDTLLSAVNDKSRKVRLHGKQAIVPEKFDKHGELVDENTPAENYVLHRCTLSELKFLSVWRAANYLEDPEQMAVKSGVTAARAESLIKRLSWFKREESRIKLLADIITPEKILVRQWENSFTNELQDGQRDSLKESSKIIGAYKQQIVSATVNVFNLPKYDPATEAKLKVIAEQEALLIQDAQIVVNG